MTISINPATFVITVPKADLTLISGTFYEHDTEAFRLELIDWEDSEIGINFLRTHNHNTTVTIAGTTFARTIEIRSPYSVEYEDGAYSVQLVGSNNNIWDVGGGILVQNQVQVIPTNSAGLIVSVQGSGVTEQDKQDIITGVFAQILDYDALDAGVTAADMMRIMLAVMSGELDAPAQGVPGTATITSPRGNKARVTIPVDGVGNRTDPPVFDPTVDTP
jgi:hypothetical protein